MKYPIYARSKHTSIVVEFTSECTGRVVISNNKSSHGVGHKSYAWHELTDGTHWEIITKEENPEFFV
jgi:hypothetical protein